MKNKNTAVIYCDSSVRAGRCGVGICLLGPNGALIEKVSRRFLGYERNNTALEARAVCEAVELALKHGYGYLKIHTDAKALVRAVQRGKARGVVLRKFLLAVSEMRKHVKVAFNWVKAHVGQKWNTICDELAKNAQWTIGQRLRMAWELVSRPREDVFVGNLGRLRRLYA